MSHLCITNLREKQVIFKIENEIKLYWAQLKNINIKN